MKITVEFDTEEEFEAFRVSGKKTRAKKGEADEVQSTGNAPVPLPPPNTTGAPAMGFPGATGFAAPAPGAAPMAGAFPAPAATGPAPEVQAIVQRISTKVNAAVQSGATPAADALTWFRGQCGPEAANATMDQIQQNFLPKLSMPTLENIAKLMAA